jgi:hypothetical protein
VNGNGSLDRGIWFERNGNAVDVFVETFGRSRRGHVLRVGLSTTVYPRN